ncbi:MAG: hypothetical protein LBC26_06305, partial [Oscillospiraceae bacterium]|nr:hypothetical protein [Oscillospiraceae bacterium]
MTNFDDYMVTTIDPAINWSDLRGLLKDRAGSYEYTTTRRTGWIKTPPGGSTATYQFSFSSNEGIRLWVNGVQLHSRWNTSYERNTTTYTNCSSTISLEPDTFYSITIDHAEGTTATNNGVVGSHQRLRWARTDGGSPFAAAIIPPEAYFLDTAFTPARITEIDTSDIGVHEPATLVMDVEHFTPRTVLKLLRSSDSRQLNPIVVPYTSLGAGKISAALPAGLAPAMYKFLAEDADPQDPAGVVRMPSKFFFTTMVNNAPRPEYPRPD